MWTHQSRWLAIVLDGNIASYATSEKYLECLGKRWGSFHLFLLIPDGLVQTQVFTQSLVVVVFLMDLLVGPRK